MRRRGSDVLAGAASSHDKSSKARTRRLGPVDPPQQLDRPIRSSMRRTPRVAMMRRASSAMNVK